MSGSVFMQQDFGAPGVREAYASYMEAMLSGVIAESGRRWGLTLERTFSRSVGAKYARVTAEICSIGFWGNKGSAQVSIGYVDGGEPLWNGRADFQEKRPIYVPNPGAAALAYSSQTDLTILMRYTFAKRSKRVPTSLSTNDVPTPEILREEIGRNIFSSRLARHLGAGLHR